jgi:sortase A
MSLSDKQKIVEQIALLFASFVWTTVVLSVIALYWVYQDVNARWDYITQAPPQALAESVAAPTSTLTPSPTATEWAGPGPTATPTVTQPPTAIPTLVVGPPDVLPETFNADEPTPIPVIVHPEEEAAEVGLEPAATTSAPAGAPTTAPAPTSAPPQFAPVADEAVPVSTGITPSRLVIDSIGVDAQIIPVGWEIVEQDGQQYSIWKVADFAVGWHKTSASLGQPGNTVMAGHHNVQGEVFRDLVNVEVGDKVVVYADGKEFDYVVDLKTIVKEKGEPLEVRQQNAQWISHTDDERLTFITCWPYTNNTHRVIVVAKPL